MACTYLTYCVEVIWEHSKEVSFLCFHPASCPYPTLLTPFSLSLPACLFYSSHFPGRPPSNSQVTKFTPLLLLHSFSQTAIWVIRSALPGVDAFGKSAQAPHPPCLVLNLLLGAYPLGTSYVHAPRGAEVPRCRSQHRPPRLACLVSCPSPSSVNV